MESVDLRANTLVFSLSANEKLAKEVCEILGLPLGEKELLHFPSKETLVRPIESVRNKDIYVIQSTCPPVNENLMELLVFVDSLKRSSCRSITTIIPYFGYARQDRKSKPREPITCKLVADLIVTAGVDRVITFDIHALQEQGFFNCQMDSLSAMPLLSYTIAKKEKKNIDNLVIVSPDHGGVIRARNIAERFNCPIAIIDKRRDNKYQPECMNIIGDIKGKDCYVVDDMIDTAGTACMAAHVLKLNGARSVKMVATHAVLSDPAHERILNSEFDDIIVTNSIPLDPKFSDCHFTVVSIAPMIAKVIYNVQNQLPLSPVYDMYK